MAGRLAGKTAFITAAAQGIGRATALALFTAGRPGRYVVYCAPHYDRATGQGMKITLVVEP